MDDQQRAKALVSEMTLAEKASLCSGEDFWHLKSVPRVGISERILVTDGPHGLRKQTEGADQLGINDSLPATCFPTACLTACSFDPALLLKIGAAIGEECRQEDVAVLLGPGVNSKRSPLCGRNFEYFPRIRCWRENWRRRLSTASSRKTSVRRSSTTRPIIRRRAA